MDDRFLEKHRREPRPEFARGLRGNLREIEADEAPRGMAWLRPALAAAFGVAIVTALFTLPAVRATAQQLLDLFRVQEFAVVQVDPARMEQLKTRAAGLEDLLGRQVVREQPTGEPQAFTTLAAAAGAAGFAPLRPDILPRQVVLDTVFVTGEGRTRYTVDAQPLRQLMEAFDIRDLPVPPGLDGGTVAIHMPRVVVQRYRNPRGSRVALVQAPSPEVSVPAGVDLARLGEIGLRLFGLSPSEASRLARAIDWRSTLVVPLVSNATSYQQVTVNGAKGLYVESSGTVLPDGRKQDGGSGVLWNRDGRVYALVGNLDRVAILQMAESVR